MADSSSNASFKVLNQDFVKLDCFDGTNFNRWKDRMMFLLTTLNVGYVLNPKFEAISEASQDASSEEKANVADLKKKRQEDEYICRRHILNTLSDRLYDLYMPSTSLTNVWKVLETKYSTERQGIDKFLIMKYLEFKMLDSIPILDQVHELQVLVNRLRNLKVILSETFQVGAIISKLPSTWNEYRKKLHHMQEDFTVEKIMRRLQIEEETRKIDVLDFSNSYNVNDVNEKPKKNNKRKAPDGSSNNKNKNDKKNNRKCYGCNKKGHYIKDCNFVKKLKKDASQAKANLVENENQEFIAIVTGLKGLQIGIVTEVHMATTKYVGWWVDSGASVHICNDMTQFKSYKEAIDKKVLTGNHYEVKVLG